MAKVKIVKYERDPPLFISKQLIKFKKILRNTTQVIVQHRICLQTDGHGETSISPYNFVAGGIINLCIICTIQDVGTAFVMSSVTVMKAGKPNQVFFNIYLLRNTSI